MRMTATYQIIETAVPPQIISQRVVLRPLFEEDAMTLYGAVHESRQELGEWLDWCRDNYNLEGALHWIRQTRTPTMWETCQNFGIFAKIGAPLLIGCIGLSNIDQGMSVANLGYWIRTSKCRLGLAREAAVAMAEYAHSTLELSRVEIAVHPLNDRSVRVARALGAIDEGLTPSRIVYRGDLVEARVFSLARY